MKLSELGEFGLIDRLRDLLGPVDAPDLIQGIDDDAAVYRVADGRVHVVTTDALIEGIHFDRSFSPMERVGFKAISSNVSDVAAMNARPLWATIALGLPAHLPVEDVEAMYRGMKRACEHYGVHLIGGDTTAAHALTLSITLIGEAREGDVAYRYGAQPGDIVCVTGDVGAAFAGLKLLLQSKSALARNPDFVPDFENFQYVIERQLAPVARTEVVDAWAAARVRPSACMDASDGLAASVRGICAASVCGATIYEAALPIDPETRRVADRFGQDVDVYALFGGEDYELVFTMSEADLQRLPREGLFTPIGRIGPLEDGVAVQTAEGSQVPLEADTFDHFRSPPPA
jgi:thiamine-monophosphate kinase